MGKALERARLDHDAAVTNLYAVAVCPLVTFADRGGKVMGTALGLQDDGNLVIIAPGNHPVWATNTDLWASETPLPAADLPEPPADPAP